MHPHGKTPQTDTFWQTRYLQESYSMKPSLLYIHIQKTAGLTMRMIFAETFGPDKVYKLGKYEDGFPPHTIEDFISLADQKKKKYHVFIGHFPFGVHQHIPQQVDQITCLRDPTVRVLSLYEYICRRHQKRYDFNEWISTHGEANNGMVKRLCGYHFLNDMPYDFFNQCQIKLPFPLDHSHAKLAISNLDTYFSNVLLTEYFNEGLVSLQKKYKTKPLFSMHNQFRNHSEIPIQPSNYSKKVIDLVKERNQLDAIVYDWAKKRFLLWLESQDSKTHQQIHIAKCITNMLTVRGAQNIDDNILATRFNQTIEQCIASKKVNDALDILDAFIQKTPHNQSLWKMLLTISAEYHHIDRTKHYLPLYQKQFGADDYSKQVSFFIIEHEKHHRSY